MENCINIYIYIYNVRTYVCLKNNRNGVRKKQTINLQYYLLFLQN